MKLKKLAFFSMFLTPVLIAVSCSGYRVQGGKRGERGGRNFPPVKKIEATKPTEMFPGVKQDPDTYDKLVSSAWTRLPDKDNYKYGEKWSNNIVEFTFTADLVNKMNRYNITVPYFCNLAFSQMTSSPFTSLMLQSGAEINFASELPDVQAVGATRSFLDGIKIGPNSNSWDGILQMVDTNIMETMQIDCTNSLPHYTPTACLLFESQNAMWQNFLQDLPSGYSLKNYKFDDASGKPIVPKWTPIPSLVYTNLLAWSNEQERADEFIGNITRFEPGGDNWYGDNPSNWNATIIESVKRIFDLYKCSPLSYEDNGTLPKYYSSALHIFNDYHFYDDNDLLQSFNIMKAIYHSFYGMGNRSGLTIYLNKDDKTSHYSIQSAKFASWGDTYTNDLKSIEIYDKKANKLLQEIPLIHQDYPVGFNKNPFNDYEYKYIAPGAYSEVNKTWGNNEYDLTDLDYKVLKNDGTELNKNEVQFELQDIQEITSIGSRQVNSWTHDEQGTLKTVEDYYK